MRYRTGTWSAAARREVVCAPLAWTESAYDTGLGRRYAVLHTSYTLTTESYTLTMEDTAHSLPRLLVIRSAGA